MKLTKRKGFNFFRSYYDVYNELETDKDKVKFIDALLDRQFLGIKPTDLKGMAKFAYISQTNSIDSQVKGYETKTNTSLHDPTVPPTVGVNKKDLTPTLQVQVQVEVQEKEQVFIERKQKFITWFNQQKKIKTGKIGMVRVLSSTDDNNLKKLFKDYKLSDFQIALDNMFLSSWVIENKMYTIAHLLAINNFNKYLGEGQKEVKPLENLYD